MKTKGFTLVELLAVIVVLAVILAITIPGISGIIGSATKGAFESDARMLLQQLEYEKLRNRDFDVTTVNLDNIVDFDLSNDNYLELRVGIVNNNPYVIIVGKKAWKNLKACGTVKNIKVVPSTDTETCMEIPLYTDYVINKGINKPKLATGMTPIKWNGIEWVDTSENDVDWYSYTTTDKKWANVRTEDGSMWVWIPRYAYQIASGYHTSTKGVINVKFLTDKTNVAIDATAIDKIPAYNGESQTNYIVHPAFTFGNKELTGIWVAKFEPSVADQSNVCYTNPSVSNCDKTDLEVKIIPGASSWRYISPGTIFTVVLGMKNSTLYGWNASEVDTHMMKNNEWGAVAYLTHSKYGKEDEVWINPSSSFITGCAGEKVDDIYSSGCNHPYLSSNGKQASTTGNVTGVYDMAGGATEYMASYLNNGHNSLNNGSSIVSATSKYKNIYPVGEVDNMASNYEVSSNIFGDAIYETSSFSSTEIPNTSWYADYSLITFDASVWLIRGGNYGQAEKGGIFVFSRNDGYNYRSLITFRPVVLVGGAL